MASPTFDTRLRLRSLSRTMLEGCYTLRGLRTPLSAEILETAKILYTLLDQPTNGSPGSAASSDTFAQASSECGIKVCDSSPKLNQTPLGSAPTMVPEDRRSPNTTEHSLSTKWTQRVPTASDISSPLLLVGVATLSGIAIAAIRRRRHFSQEGQPDA